MTKGSLSKEPYRPRLLRETAEIALTLIKRYIEGELMERFSMRRLSAPLFLEADSPLQDPGDKVAISLPHRRGEFAIVRGLDRWLREQLVRYDIAPGFGVFTVMQALRPELPETATQSCHVSAWACQYMITPEEAVTERLIEMARVIYSLLLDTERMILDKFPHLSATLPEKLVPVDTDELARRYPELSPGRREYTCLHDTENRALVVIEGMTARIVVWNPEAGCPLTLAEIAIDSTPDATSVGGTLLRDQIAMQILHQPHLLQ